MGSASVLKMLRAGFSDFFHLPAQLLLGIIGPARVEEMDYPEGPVPERGDGKQKQDASLPLPAAFLEFLSENGLDPAVYSMASTIPRYIR